MTDQEKIKLLYDALSDLLSCCQWSGLSETAQKKAETNAEKVLRDCE